MRRILVALVMSSGGCTGIPWDVALSQPMSSAPESYYEWFQEVGDCIDQPELATAQRFAEISWNAAEDITHGESQQQAIGLWVEPHDIAIVRGRLLDEVVVKHEIVHDLLGEGSHDAPFYELCAGR